MAELWAFVAAVAYAFGTVLQQRGSFETEAGAGDVRFLVQLLRRPIWLLGAAIQVVGWITQALALHQGPLVVVQAWIATSLVIALPLGAWLTGQQLTPSVWVGAAAVIAGIVLFLSVGDPTGGTTTPSGWDWWSATLTSLFVISVLALVGWRGAPGRQAALFGSAAGVVYGFMAAVEKSFTYQLSGGLSVVLASWEVYLLVICTVIGFAFQQSALKTGALAPALGSANALTLVVSVVLGFTVYHESMAAPDGRRVVALIGLALAMAGVALLARTPGATAVQPQPDVPTRAM